VDDAALLDLWTRLAAVPERDRGLGLLAEIASEGGIAGGVVSAGRWPLGSGHRALLDARRRWFGDQLAVVSVCPGCSARVEATIEIGALIRATNDVGAQSWSVGLSDGMRVAVCRPLTFDDLAAAAVCEDADSARQTLLDRCVTGVDTAALSADDVARLSAELEHHDPAAVVRLGCACPDCGRSWQARFDPGASLWTDIDDRARVVLDQVAQLAASFGWGEADVLALPPIRRLAYLGAAR
jgi:hypothetical protein